MASDSAYGGTVSVIPASPVHIHGLWSFARPPGFSARARSTAAHLVHLVSDGGYVLTLAGRVWRVEAPALIWYHGAEAVAWRGDARAVRFLSCAFSSPGLSPPPDGERVRPAPPALRTAFAGLQRRAATGGLRGALAFQAAACTWLEALLDAYAVADEADLWERVERRALAAGQWPAVGELAAWAGTSVSTLERACRTRHGCPPGVRLRRLRLAQAEALAAHGGLPRPQVARLVGYADRRSLRRALSRGEGRPPVPAQLSSTVLR